jgi:hypothetical protein
MTKEEFISKHRIVQHQLTHLGFVPWGVIFSIELAMVGAIICLIVLLFVNFDTDALVSILCELVFCVLVFGSLLFADRKWRQKLNKSGLNCPSCQKWLGGNSGLAVLKTGWCDNCGEKIFDV